LRKTGAHKRQGNGRHREFLAVLRVRHFRTSTELDSITKLRNALARVQRIVPDTTIVIFATLNFYKDDKKRLSANVALHPR
jgi:hypothetical protein